MSNIKMHDSSPLLSNMKSNHNDVSTNNIKSSYSNGNSLDGGPSSGFEKTRLELLRSGHLFCDSSFPADHSSLYYSQSPPCQIVWMRPSEIVAANAGDDDRNLSSLRQSKRPEFICETGVNFGELRQGELGDCWVVAALAAMSSQPSLIRRNIPSGQSFHPDWYAGMFAFRFWRFGRWHEVIVDDLLPVRPGGSPLFVHSGQRHEFWPMLLEKAYAKLNGSYEALNVGLVGDAMDDLAGGLTESYTLPSADEQGIQPPSDLDDILIKAFDRRSLITARIKTKGMPSPGFIIPPGFVPGQAFGLTDCRKLRLTDSVGSRLARLVRLKNLWPSVKVGWTGPWSEHSGEWLSLPDQDRSKVGLVKSGDEFWMSMEDFQSNFDYLDLCHLTDPGPTQPGPLTSSTLSFPVVRLHGRWLRGVSCGGRPYVRASHWANPQFKLHIGSPDPSDSEGVASLVIALMQSDRRRLRHRAPRLASIGFVLYRLPLGSNPPMSRAFFDTNHHVASVDFFFDSREVVKRMRLLPGDYLLVPCTYSADQPGDFLLRLIFDHPDRSCEPALSRVEVSGLAANGPEHDKQFELVQPRASRLIYEASGESMSVDAFQLEILLNQLLRDDHRTPYGSLDTDACRSLVALFDREATGRLSETDFRRLWEILRSWSRLFAGMDPQRTGHVTSLDFRIILEQADHVNILLLLTARENKSYVVRLPNVTVAHINMPTKALNNPGAVANWIKGIADKRQSIAESVVDFNFVKSRARQLKGPDVFPDDSRSELASSSGSSGGGGILYWMIRDQRVQDNWAFLYAQRLALKFKVPLCACFCIAPSGQADTLRHFSFMINGLKEVEKECHDLDIGFHLLQPSSSSAPAKAGQKRKHEESTASTATLVAHSVADLVKELGIGCVVVDQSPLRSLVGWIDDLAKQLPDKVPLCQVDAHNIVPVWLASDKLEYAARTIRPKLHDKSSQYLTEFPPLIRHPHSPSGKSGKSSIVDWTEVEKAYSGDSSVQPVDWATPGSKAGLAQLHAFVNNQLKDFATYRNDPTKVALSDLSPWFHFGQLAPQRAILEVQAVRSQCPHAADIFIEEAFVRRELADNFCHYNANYDSIKGAYKWARDTLRKHASDERKPAYSHEQLEQAQTADDLWNAAQLQLTRTGKMHGFLRMYWAKKILEWHKDGPDGALQSAFELNDRFSLDGSDPNGVVGIMWSICGIHDQGWAERPIFGKIRCMTYKGCKGKFSIPAFVARFNNNKIKG